MKYFGEKSLSSVLSTILHISWYVVLIGAIIAVVGGSIVLFCTPARDFISTQMAREEAKQQHLISTENSTCWKGFECQANSKDNDREDWETFKNLPLPVRILILPWLVTVIILLLLIIKKSQKVFTNFKKDIVFNLNNVHLISKINKLLIGYSILTCNLSALLLCVLLLMVCEILKNGTALKEELELTV